MSIFLTIVSIYLLSMFLTHLILVNFDKELSLCRFERELLAFTSFLPIANIVFMIILIGMLVKYAIGEIDFTRFINAYISLIKWRKND